MKEACFLVTLEPPFSAGKTDQLKLCVLANDETDAIKDARKVIDEMIGNPPPDEWIVISIREFSL